MFAVHLCQHVYHNQLLAVWSYLNWKTKTNSSKKVNTRWKTQRRRHSTKTQARLIASRRFATKREVRCDNRSLVTSEKWRNNELTRRMELLYESIIYVITKHHLLRQHKVRSYYICNLRLIISHWQSLCMFIADKIVVNMNISLPKVIHRYWNQRAHGHKLCCWNILQCKKI
jgi:hypothetical protein